MNRLTICALWLVGITALTVATNWHEVRHYPEMIVWHEVDPKEHLRTFFRTAILLLPCLLLPHRLVTHGLGIVLGAGLSNLVISPRVWESEDGTPAVPDYIHQTDYVIQWGEGASATFWSFGVWNLADVCVSIGVVLLGIGVFKSYRQLVSRFQAHRLRRFYPNGLRIPQPIYKGVWWKRWWCNLVTGHNGYVIDGMGAQCRFCDAQYDDDFFPGRGHLEYGWWRLKRRIVG